MPNVEMRKVYCDTLIELAEKDPRIVVINSDSMKVTMTKEFADRFSDRSFNVGIAEANMAGVAAGLATYGKIPVINSFTCFATRRCFDQITILVAYAGLNVKIVGNNPGLLSELNGGTHMSMEDIGIMRTLPGMLIEEPADAWQLKRSLAAIINHEGPVYLRLNRGVAEDIYSDNDTFELGKGDVLREGEDVAIFTAGFMVSQSLKAADMLEAKGIHATVVNLHTIKPIDAGLVIKLAKMTKAVVTVENHSVIGGLGDAVAKVLIENYPVRMKYIGVQDRFGEVGKRDYLMKVFGLSPEQVAQEVEKFVAEK